MNENSFTPVPTPNLTPSAEQINKALANMVKEAKGNRERLVQEGAPNVFRQMRDLTLKNYPYLQRCLNFYYNMGGMSGERKDGKIKNDSQDFKVGSKVHHKLIGVVSAVNKSAKNSTGTRKRGSRSPISKWFQAYQQLCDEIELVPSNRMAAILMRLPVEKIIEYQRILRERGYEFTASADHKGLIQVTNPRKAREAQLERKIKELEAELKSLRNE